MNDMYELSEEEILRRRRKRRARKLKKRQRKIRGLIMLTLTLFLFFLIIWGVISGIVKLVRHFTNKEAVSIIYDSDSEHPQEEFPDTYEDDDPDLDTPASSNDFPAAAVKSDDYIDITSEDIKAPYAVLMRAEDLAIIAGRECDTTIYPASMTKVMTLLVAAEHLDQIPSTYTFTYDDIAPHIYAGASRAGFEENETVPVIDILYGLILPSGADAATAIANAVAGSEDAFAQLMNEKCTEIGLTKTHFVNPSGLYDETQVTTCAEMATIMAYAMQNDLCAQVLSTYQYTTTKTTQNPDGIALTSTMFSRMYGTEVENVTITAGKTGYTAEAGNCMVSYAIKDSKAYVCVTAASTNKWHCIYDAFKIYGQYLP
jgi:D-alanyl-D-alanine carboxypeptidase (penicillin-binding protein 5/6)